MTSFGFMKCIRVILIKLDTIIQLTVWQMPVENPDNQITMYFSFNYCI